MKIITSLLLILGCSCIPNHVQVENDKAENSNSDTLEILVQVKSVLPIGWGTKYSCEIEELYNGTLDGIDSTFVLGISVGQDETYLEMEKCYELHLVKTDRKSKESYMPGGTTGVMDDTRTIWDLTDIKPKDC